jgi:hypothetical protein
MKTQLQAKYGSFLGFLSKKYIDKNKDGIYNEFIVYNG